MAPSSLLPAPPRLRPLGPGGKPVSSLAWGMWRLTEGGRTAADTARLVHAALDAGITLLDTADIYGFDGANGFGDAEVLLGEALAAEPALRDKMVLASKGGIRPPLPYDQSPSYLAEAIDASLRRLQTDHIDLWQVHRPDLLTHPEELARSLEDAVTSGKVGAVGVSNFTPAQIAALRAHLTIPLASTQPEFSPLKLDPLENGELDDVMAHGTAVLAWSPLGQGRIAAPGTPREAAVAAALDAVAEQHGVSRTAATYSWIMAHPAGVIPIVGSQQPSRIAEAADAYKVSWTRAAWYGVLVAARGEPLP
jgi:predicted oxidoreductase